MKDVSFIDNSEWVKELYFKDIDISSCIECCFSKKYIKRPSNCTSVKDKLHIPNRQCGYGSRGHHERN